MGFFLLENRFPAGHYIVSKTMTRSSLTVSRIYRQVPDQGKTWVRLKTLLHWVLVTMAICYSKFMHLCTVPINRGVHMLRSRFAITYRITEWFRAFNDFYHEWFCWFKYDHWCYSSNNRFNEIIQGEFELKASPIRRVNSKEVA